MDFILGFSFILLLAFFTFILTSITKRLPGELIFSSVLFMLLGDAVLVGLWYYGLIDLIQSVKEFKLGIAGAFAIAAFSRAIYFSKKLVT